MKYKTRLLIENVVSWIVAAVLFVAMCSVMLGCEQSRGESTILVFSAKWCVSCKADDACLEANRLVGIRVVQVDVDQRPDWVARYGITRVPSYVVLLPNGNFITTWDKDKAVELARR